MPPGLLAVQNGTIGQQQVVPACGAPTWAEVDLDAIAANTRWLVAHVGPRVGVMAVVKANGYGHGAVPVAKAALAAGAARLAVGRLDEALELRAHGIGAPILIMGHVPVWGAQRCVDLGLTCTVNDRALAEALAGEARRRGRTAAVHVKVDTGLNRYGLLSGEAVGFGRWVADHPGLELEGLYTHLAAADEPDQEFTYRQLSLFGRVVKQLRRAGIRPPLLHAANSAATLRLPEAHFDLVRTGAALYGLQATGEAVARAPLQPALTFKTQIIRLWNVPAGAYVSYGCTYRTPRATRLALLAAGYGDGLSRALSNRGTALVGGRRYPIVGRVCMDLTIIDVGKGGNVEVGDEAVLLGRQGDARISADELAKILGTINYDVVCAVSARVPRLYFSHGRLVAVRTLNGEHSVGEGGG